MGVRLTSDAPQRSMASERAFKWISLVAAACLVGFIVFVAVRDPHKSNRVLGVAGLEAPRPATLTAGTPAPLFALARLGGGAPVTLDSFRGRPVIVNFFASWCPDCRAELGAMATVATQYAGHVAVVGVDSNDSSTTQAQALLTAAHAVYPVGVDATAQVAVTYLLTALPVTYFLDSRGRVVGTAFGPQTAASLRTWVRRLS